MDLLVSTFRTMELPQLREINETTMDHFVQMQQKAPSAAADRGNSISRESEGRKSIRKHSNTARQSFANQAALKLEAKKAERSSRMSLYKELLKSKPDNKYEDAKDAAAINYAQNNMGDYKLKTSQDYIVPENERIDTDKKKRQINLLSEGIHMLKEVLYLNLP
jgi:hypothetical protein